jgi:exodeoxyribonuclease-3
MALYKKGMDVKVNYPQIGAPEPMDNEGRMVTLELPDLYFNLVYTPNAGDGLRRLKERQEWDKRYAEYIHGLDKIRRCGSGRTWQDHHTYDF